MRVALAATAAALAFALVGTGVAFAADDGYVTDAELTGTAASEPAQNETLPNDGQLEYQRDSFAAFCHFGPNTFANIEWGESYGNGMPEAYVYMNELSSFDADGYVKMIKDAGFSRLVVTAKHHDGFCIWQSKYTDYDMEKVTNYKNGEGDILADLSAACTEYDIDMGLYLSPWDIHDESYGYDPDKGESVTDGIGTSIDPDVNYNEYYVGQLTEILDNDKYGNDGKFVEVWMDGAKGSGANAQVYDYTRWANTIHELESENCIIFQCAQHTGVRWIGNENGTSVSTATDELWSPVKLNSARTDYDPNTQGGVQVGYADGDLWTVPEADARITSGWFWGPNKSTPKSLEDLSAMYFNSIGHGATLLINIPPNDQGTVDSQIKARVEEFASNIKMSFDDNLATGGTAKATSAYGNDKTYGPGKVLDGDKDTFWCANESADQSLIIELGKKQTFDIVSIEEAIQNGQRIDSFKVSYRTDDGSWKEFGSGATIGSKRLVRAAEVSSDAIKIEFGIDEVFDGEQALAQITEVGVYKASPAFEIPTPIPTGLTAIDNTEMAKSGSWTAESISSCYEGTSQWTSNTSSTLTFTFTGTQFNIVGTADPGHGTMGVSIDGGDVIQVATNNVSARNTSALLYSSDTLENKEHTVVISVIRGAVGIDAAAFLPEGMTMVDFETAAFTMDEDSTYELTLRRIGDTSEALTVNVGFEPGTATQDHFDTAAKQVTFAAGQDEATVTVSTRRVTEGEQSSGSADGDRQFYVSLALDGDGVIGGFTDVVTVTITDVDQDLDEVVTKAEAVDTDNYTAASVAALNEALEAARAAYKNAEMSAADVRAAMKALQDAIDNLVSSASEIPAEDMTVTAGSEELPGNASEGPVSYAADENEDTFWSSEWDGDEIENLWLQVAFDEPTAVSALRYLPRQTTGDPANTGSCNGTVTEYKVLYSDDGTDWQVAATGTWSDYEDKSWRTAEFVDPVTAKYFRLQAVHTFAANGNDTSMSAAEIRLVAAPTVEPGPEPVGGQYTDENPFVFPVEGETATLEFEYGKFVDDHTNDNGWPMVTLDTLGVTIVDAVNFGDEIHVPFSVETPGTYNVTLQFSSGSTTNALAWSDDADIIAAGNIDAGADDAAGALHTVTFTMTASRAGESTLVFGARDEGKAPRLDKLTITLEKGTEPEPTPADKDALKAYVDEVSGTDLSAYTDETAQAFTAALDNARTILDSEDATQDQVDSALATLKSAFQSLAEKPVEPEPVDKAALEAAIEAAKKADTEGKTDESVAALNGAIEKAEAVLDDADATQDEVDAAVTALNKAVADLEDKPVEPTPADKAALKAYVDEVSGTDLSAYTDETAQAFTAALDNARTILDSEDATQDQVDSALATLKSAFQSLAEKPGPEPGDDVVTDELQAAVDAAASKDESAYTAESWAAFKQALAAAQAVLDDPDATQADVDSALAALQAAEEALVASEPGTDEPDPDQSGTDEPGDVTDPGYQKPGTNPDDQKPGDTTKPGGSTTGGSTSGGNLAQTGDPTSMVAVLATALAGAGALVASHRRR